MAAEDGDRRARRRDRDDRARRRLRPAGRAHPGAEGNGNHYVISGQKTFITNGQTANLIIVVAKTDPSAGAKGTSLIVVETDDAEGFQRGRNLDKVGLDAQDTSELFFNDVRVPTANLLGPRRRQGLLSS